MQLLPAKAGVGGGCVLGRVVYVHPCCCAVGVGVTSMCVGVTSMCVCNIDVCVQDGKQPSQYAGCRVASCGWNGHHTYTANTGSIFAEIQTHMHMCVWCQATGSLGRCAHSF